jgi:POT family proton-dependent oligopeptide transporter
VTATGALPDEGEAAEAPSGLFFGHPWGLAYLSGSESFERFAYSGMQTLLVLYLGHQLLLPGHVEHVVGFSALRAALDHLWGHPLSPIALASAIFGIYTGAVYVTPIFGGLLADRLLGRTRTVILGACLLMAGHFLMALEPEFLLALGCLILGVGCFKGNLASQVGELYAPGDLRRADAFQLYMIGISTAVIISPLVCGGLGQRVAWHWGFTLAGVGMAAALGVYLLGLKRYPKPAERPRARTKAREPLSSKDRATILLLVALLPALALTAVGNQQMFNAYLVWGETHLDLRLAGGVVPVTWLISADAVIATVVMALSVLFWRWWGRVSTEPDEGAKLLIGGAISASAPLVLALASALQAVNGRPIGLGWAIGFHIVNEIGVANVFPVGLALFSRAAPASVGGVMIGVYYLSMAASNLLVGWLGGLLERTSSVSFWLLHAAVVAAGELMLLVLILAFRRLLAAPAPGR